MNYINALVLTCTKCDLLVPWVSLESGSAILYGINCLLRLQNIS